MSEILAASKPEGVSQAEYRAFKVEQHGIDLLPEQDRKLTPVGLFFMWAGTMCNIENVVTGALLVSLGLSFVQSTVLIVIGSMSFFLAAAASLQGPRSGTSTFGVARAVFGPRGGKGLSVVSWATMICYEIEGASLTGLALLALGAQAGVHRDRGIEVIAVLIAMALQVVVPIFGHATLIKATRVLAVPFIVLFILMAILAAPKVDTSTISHGAGWPTIFIGLTIAIASTGIGWVVQGNDYSRYLRSRTQPRKIVSSVVLGGGVPCMLLGILGAAVASVVKDSSDPISGLPHVFPDWFLVPYLILAIPQLLCINSLNFYSSGLNIQAMGIHLRRVIATSIDCVLCTALTVLVIFSNNFNKYLVDFEQLLIIWVAPFAGVYLLDAYFRRNRYDPESLMSGPRGVYWGRDGVQWGAVAAQLGGMASSAFCLNSGVFIGPIARAADHSDFSALAGIIVAAALYAVLGRRTVEAQNAVLSAEDQVISEEQLDRLG